MSEVAVEYSSVSRDTSFSILKAIAIIFMVAAHSGGPSWWVNTAYIFSVSVFFLCTGYFFKLKYLVDSRTYLWNRLAHIYRPFWIWSVAFLILHNFFIWIGFISEKSGNSVGEVALPYDGHDIFQHLWSITFNMSGYDPFLCDTFWFFRTLLVSSVAFLFLFLVVRKLSRWKSPVAVAGVVLALSLGLALWKVLGNLQVTGLAQGGYRELMALAFICMGFIYRRSLPRWRPRWLVAWIGLVLLGIFSYMSPSSLGETADLTQFLSLPLPVLGAFVFLHYFSDWCAVHQNGLTRGLIYIGDRTFYIFAFHLLAFKLVSILKVLVMDLPWAYVGQFPVVHEEGQWDYFFLLYMVVGIALPLMVVAGWKRLDKTYNLTWLNCFKYVGLGLLVVLNLIKDIIIKVSLRIWRFVMGFLHDMKEFIKASNPRDE